jgi:hypothetical protein
VDLAQDRRWSYPLVTGDGWRFVYVWSDSFGLAASKPLHDGTPGCIVTLSNDSATVLMSG